MQSLSDSVAMIRKFWGSNGFEQLKIGELTHGLLLVKVMLKYVWMRDEKYDY